MSFWDSLPSPFFALAPLADVTDPAYRRLIAEIQSAHVMWTEFVSADGLYHLKLKQQVPDEENPLLRDLQFSKNEYPIVAQLFGSNYEPMVFAAGLCKELGFSGIDINMGCPDRSIEKQGSGAAMIRSPETALSIIEAARTAGLPVSVKTRLGYSEEEIDTWIRTLLEVQLPALTVHLRTRKEMSSVPAHWEYMGRIVALRNEISPGTKIIGNGDVASIAHARELIHEHGCDGAMLGRAIFGNPWLFEENATPTLQDKLAALGSLATYFNELTPPKSFHVLKKHVKVFVQGHPLAKELRARLTEASSIKAFQEEIARALY